MTAIDWATWLICVFYVGAFLAVSRQAAREAGRSIWLFGQGSQDQRLAAFLFRLAFAGAVLVTPIAWLLGSAMLPPVLPAYGFLDVAGNLLSAVGAAVALASQVYMGRSWRIGAAEGEIGPIVNTGPFALSRNPVFVGQALLFLGLALGMGDGVHLGLAAVVLLAINRQVVIEEKVLDLTIGEPYRLYCQRVGRWF